MAVEGQEEPFPARGLSGREVESGHSTPAATPVQNSTLLTSEPDQARTTTPQASAGGGFIRKAAERHEMLAHHKCLPPPLPITADQAACRRCGAASPFAECW